LLRFLVRILNRYILWQVIGITVVAVTVLTGLLVLGNAFKRVFELLVNYDVPLLTLLELIILLVPQALTFTLPWGTLIAVLLVFGRMSQELELQSIRAAGIGLAPIAAPVVLFSLVICLLCILNNAHLAPMAMTRFKVMAYDLARSNPTAFLRAQEPIVRFSGYRIYIEKKSGNKVEGVFVWELNEKGIPKRSIRAESGTITADLRDLSVSISLTNACQEERSGSNPERVGEIQTGIRATTLPIRISLVDLQNLDAGVDGNISLLTLGDLNREIFSEDSVVPNLMPLLTELQRRFAFALAPFTFVLIGIPLAIKAQRRETSLGFAISLGVVIIYYLLIILSKALEERAAWYPEVIVWLPNFVFQALGFFLLWKSNRSPL
jgi:lipopolysaccharide export system permease protein